MLSHHNEFTSYVKWIKQEEVLYFETNNFLMEQSQIDNFKAILQKIININPLIAHLLQKQCIFIKNHVHELQNPIPRKKFLDKILTASQLHAYQVFDIRNKVILTIASYLSAVHPLNINDEGNFEAYIRYINSIIKRIILNPYIGHIKKINKYLQGASFDIRILSHTFTHQGEVVDSLPDLHYYQDAPLIASLQIINYLYFKNAKKFETQVISKYGLYKQGKKAKHLKNLNYICIGIQLNEINLLMLGKEDNKIGFFLLSEFLMYAHEELHALRYLRGASRTHISQIMPDILAISYSCKDGNEEYFTIKAGKYNEAKIDMGYGFPARLTHQGVGPSKMESDYTEVLSFLLPLKNLALIEAGYESPLTIDLSQCHQGHRISHNNKINLNLSPLIDRFFYGENLEDVETLSELIKQWRLKPASLPNNHTPLHLLVSFSRLWPCNNDPIFFKKQLNALLNLFLGLGMDINCEDDYGETPLSIAVKHDDLYLVQLLIDKGANLFLFNAKSENILTLALELPTDNVSLFLLNVLMQPEYHDLALKLFLGNDSPILMMIKKNRFDSLKLIFDFLFDEFSYTFMLLMLTVALSSADKYHDRTILNFLYQRFKSDIDSSALHSLLCVSVSRLDFQRSYLKNLIYLGANYEALLREKGAISKAAGEYTLLVLPDFIQRSADIFQECQKGVLYQVLLRSKDDNDFKNIFFQLRNKLTCEELAFLIVQEDKHKITPLHFASKDFKSYPQKLHLLMKHLKKHNLSSKQPFQLDWSMFGSLQMYQLKQIDFSCMCFKRYDNVPSSALMVIQKSIGNQLIKKIQKSTSIRQLYGVYLQLEASKNLLIQKNSLDCLYRFFSFLYKTEFNRVKSVFQYKINDIISHQGVHYPRQQAMLQKIQLSLHLQIVESAGKKLRASKFHA